MKRSEEEFFAYPTSNDKVNSDLYQEVKNLLLSLLESPVTQDRLSAKERKKLTPIRHRIKTDTATLEWMILFLEENYGYKFSVERKLVNNNPELLTKENDSIGA